MNPGHASGPRSVSGSQTDFTVVTVNRPTETVAADEAVVYSHTFSIVLDRHDDEMAAMRALCRVVPRRVLTPTQRERLAVWFSSWVTEPNTESDDR